MEHNERIDSSAGEPVLACKRRKHLRLAALAVCCALLGGIAGGAATGLLLQGRERAANAVGRSADGRIRGRKHGRGVFRGACGLDCGRIDPDAAL